jgi:hypothetical protein
MCNIHKCYIHVNTGLLQGLVLYAFGNMQTANNPKPKTYDYICPDFMDCCFYLSNNDALI